MSKKKIAIVGAGIGGIATALTFKSYGLRYNLFDTCDEEIDLYYDSTKPIERVGQGSTLEFNRLFFPQLGQGIDAGYSLATNMRENNLGLTLKTGINYEGWGKAEEFFHYFYVGNHAVHYQPHLLSQAVISSGMFNVIDTDISDLSDIQADWIIDCRGRQYNNYEDDYDMLVNPINSALLYRKPGRDLELTYTRCVATPNGWTFVIPNVDSVSYGYLYNDSITSYAEATEDFIARFDAIPDGSMSFKNYVAKDCTVGDNILLNGNRYSFVEPLEASSVATYIFIAQGYIDYINGLVSKDDLNKELRAEIKKVEDFILWHYRNGSKYDTPFWKYAKSLPFRPNKEFTRFLLSDTYIPDKKEYSQWNTFCFKLWNDNIVKS
tara:strand:- start:1274 stop:2410 length:1137 start_codon:yes stop_codon:yes gene_type:complete